jgi:CheY-like chemotaxis protein
LSEIKTDPRLKRIPVVVLTSSAAERDILQCYDLQANSFITKPVDLEQFEAVVDTIRGFWLNCARLPGES